ncbi:hypothetical protein MRB53_010262 [Persea americana]|uniref:Uncharacterized protein n=1 Tax=Persea americana TaxID=3435 RepID=A0ACC2LRI7_PERAE|nr:hypothetical protein MRB53_010262 [Persea americana]
MQFQNFISQAKTLPTFVDLPFPSPKPSGKHHNPPRCRGVLHFFTSCSLVLLISSQMSSTGEHFTPNPSDSMTVIQPQPESVQPQTSQPSATAQSALPPMAASSTVFTEVSQVDIKCEVEVGDGC